MKPGAEWLFQLSRSPPGPLTACGCWRPDRKPFHSYLPVPSVGRRRSSPRARLGSRPDVKYAVALRDAYAQLNVNSNWFAVFQNFRGVDALPAVMSCRAARLRPSRPKVERLRARAYGVPPTVAVPITG